jgi:ribosome-associated protein
MDGPLEHRRGAGRGYHTSSPFTLLSFTMRAHRSSDDDVAPAGDDSAPDRPSKTQLKKASHELQDLGEALVEMPDDRLAGLDIDESLRDAIHAYKHTRSHEGRRRQMQYIGKLMRSVDPEPIRERLKVWDGVSAEHTAKQHRVERWRDRLIEDETAVDELARIHPGIDTRHLRALSRKAREERGAGSPPRAYRELFRMLREIVVESVREDDAV